MGKMGFGVVKKEIAAARYIEQYIPLQEYVKGMGTPTRPLHPLNNPHYPSFVPQSAGACPSIYVSGLHDA